MRQVADAVTVSQSVTTQLEKGVGARGYLCPMIVPGEGTGA
ncbi:hypothetical protein M2163_001245 [Streptomyces sp. SAI-135]|nr:hypothetical protein [Streptomyces sp. SAI-090]MDH6614137.1 hypothetical protein [Streptomyces sp. SAI-135]